MVGTTSLTNPGGASFPETLQRRNLRLEERTEALGGGADQGPWLDPGGRRTRESSKEAGGAFAPLPSVFPTHAVPLPPSPPPMEVAPRVTHLNAAMEVAHHNHVLWLI